MPAFWRERLPRDLSKPIVSYFRDGKGKLFAATAAVESNGVAYIGAAVCHEEDQFCRRIGRAIATGRALKAAASGQTVSDRDFLDNPRYSTSVICTPATAKAIVAHLRSVEKECVYGENRVFSELAIFFESPDLYAVDETPGEIKEPAVLEAVYSTPPKTENSPGLYTGGKPPIF